MARRLGRGSHWRIARRWGTMSASPCFYTGAENGRYQWSMIVFSSCCVPGVVCCAGLPLSNGRVSSDCQKGFAMVDVSLPSRQWIFASFAGLGLFALVFGWPLPGRANFA
ncbi:hypothetical protein EV126DRAFT_121658 [Verticillium dahliae]|nr:hypothetical protein EV126DRAFT_121658 [Verticillium dahliae]